MFTWYTCDAVFVFTLCSDIVAPSSKTLGFTRILDGFPITVTDPGALPGAAAGGAARPARACAGGNVANQT